MNQNKLQPDLIQKQSEQPVGLKAERLTEKKLKALG